MNLRETLKEKSDDELIYKLQSNYFSDEARLIAVEILKSRGTEYTNETTSAFEPEKSSKPTLIALKTSLLGCFTGTTSLAWSFWVLPFIFLLLGIILLIIGEIFEPNNVNSLFTSAAGIVFIVGPAVHAFCIFKCIENTNHKIFSGLAFFVGLINSLIFLAVIVTGALTLISE